MILLWTMILLRGLNDRNGILVADFRKEPGWAGTVMVPGGAMTVLKSGSSTWEDEAELRDEHEGERCRERMRRSEREGQHES